MLHQGEDGKKIGSDNDDNETSVAEQKLTTHSYKATWVNAVIFIESLYDLKTSLHKVVKSRLLIMAIEMNAHNKYSHMFTLYIFR